MSLFTRNFHARLLALALLGATTATAVAGPSVEVWKSPLCGCCEGWIDHLRGEGFTVDVHDVDDVTPIAAARGIGDDLASCHTAVVDGYVVEGHVPAADIRRLLAERPPLTGLAVPGMPSGTPGMGADGTPYEVIGFTAAGARTVFARH